MIMMINSTMDIINTVIIIVVIRIIIIDFIFNLSNMINVNANRKTIK